MVNSADEKVVLFLLYGTHVNVVRERIVELFEVES